MADFRQEITNRPQEFLDMMAQVERDLGSPITAECYKRPKETDNPELAPYFSWKSNIGWYGEEAFGENTFGPELAARIADIFEKLTPAYEYFTRFRA